MKNSRKQGDDRFPGETGADPSDAAGGAGPYFVPGDLAEEDPAAGKKRPATVEGMLKGYALWAAAILVVSILLELFFFNYNHWHAPAGPELTAGSYVPAGYDFSALYAGESEEGGPESGSGSGSDYDDPSSGGENIDENGFYETESEGGGAEAFDEWENPVSDSGNTWDSGTEDQGMDASDPDGSGSSEEGFDGTEDGGDFGYDGSYDSSGEYAGESGRQENGEEGSGSGIPGLETGDFPVRIGSGLEQTEYGTFLITNPDKAYLELQEIHARVDNLYLNVINPASPAVYYALQFTDSANANLRGLDEKPVVSGVPESRYIQLHLTGITRTMRIYFHAEAGEEIHVRRIRLNVDEPLFVHPGRIAFLWLIGMLLVIFGPRSWIYTTRLNIKEGRQRLLILVVVVLNIVATSWAGRAADPSVWRELRDERDYQEKEYELYADALLQGHTYLDIRPPRYLTRMRNPYDRTQRNEVSARYDEKVLWDAAYYNGRYYVYFGIVPALLSFVPYRLLTGTALPTWRAVLFMADLLWILSFYLVYILVRKYFRKTSLGVYLLLSACFAPAAGVIYLATFPVVYSVPFIYGLVFTVAGLALWLRGFDRKGRVHRSRLAVGSLCIALTLGCRPTMILTFLLAFPVFWQEIRGKRFFWPSKDSLLNTAAVILPFIPVGLLQMRLNSARFGSPFDFGADYNLTVTDLTKKTFSIAKNIPALFQELVQPLQIQPQFPFIRGIEVTTDYQGYMFIDKMLGGFFALNMLALFCFWIFRIRKKMAAQKVFGLAAVSFALAAVLIELDVQVGGISQRYMIDYGWLLMLTAILAILTILDHTDTHGYYAYLKVILVLAVICVGVNYLTVFSDGQAISVRTYNPVLFYRIKYLLLPS